MSPRAIAGGVAVSYDHSLLQAAQLKREGTVALSRRVASAQQIFLLATQRRVGRGHQVAKIGTKGPAARLSAAGPQDLWRDGRGIAQCNSASSSTPWIALPRKPITDRRVKGDCGSRYTRETQASGPSRPIRWTAIPWTPSAAESAFTTTTLIDPGRPAGSTRRRCVQVGRPATVAVTCVMVDSGTASPTSPVPSTSPTSAGLVNGGIPISVSRCSG